MVWDDEHNGETMNFIREDDEVYIFDEDGMELSLSKENVVDLGDDHPPVNREAGKHYISTYDGSVSYGPSLPSTQNFNNSLPSSPNSRQSGGKRKKGKTTKGKKAKAKKGRKTKKSKRR